MPEDNKNENATPPVPANRMVNREQVKVRVVGKQPIAEGGQVYHPARKEAGKQLPADTFTVPAKRVAALGEHVEVIEEPEAK